MEPHVRAWVAYVAGRLIAGSDKRGVFDVSAGRHVPLTGSVSPEGVRVFDVARGQLFSGRGNGSTFTMLDHARTAYVSLTIAGTRFMGVDHGANHKFSGMINGTAVSLFDDGDGSWSYYSV